MSADRYRPICSAVLLAAMACAHASHTHSAHVHGEAKLGIVREGASIVLWLRVPGQNMMGFEHDPVTPAELETVRDVMAFLKNPAQWVQLDAAGGCTVQTVDVRPPFKTASNGASGDSVPLHSGSPRNEAEHSKHENVEATYRYECRSPLSVRGIDISLIRAYPSLHKIQVDIVSDDWQGSQLLQPGVERVHFSR